MRIGRVVSFAKLPLGALFRFTIDDVVKAIKAGSSIAGNYVKVDEDRFIDEYGRGDYVKANKRKMVEYIGQAETKGYT